ncbi:MAG: lipopolysaccharide biosynthesis protein [Thomasclavelia sp.]
MKKETRKYKFMSNIVVGYIVQVLIILLQFINRSIFVRYLPVDYLGINGLYTNILSLLSLAELGIGNVMVYSLYKPVANDDYPRIVSLMEFYKKVYRYIIVFVSIVGILLIPFLPLIIDSNLDLFSLIIYYILFLIGTISSYFSAHKIALLNANQDVKLQKLVTLFVTVGQQIVQIIILVIFKQYLLYLIVQIIATVSINLIISLIVDKKYYYLKEKYEKVLINEKYFFENVFSTALYKVGSVIINSTDNVLISSIVNLAAVGLYSNYYMLVNTIQTFLSIINSSLIYSIGNLNTEDDKEKMLNVFNAMILFYNVVACIGFISFYYQFNDFIIWWLGNDYLLDLPTVFIIAFNFYLNAINNPIWMCREATGLFIKVKYLMLIRAFINIVLSIILGICLETLGILLATAISLVVTSFWYEPNILYRIVFEKNIIAYWKKQLKHMLTGALLCLIIVNLLNILNINIGSIMTLIVREIIIITIVVIIYILMNRKGEEIKFCKRFLFNK